jgi:hypothetical protein
VSDAIARMLALLNEGTEGEGTGVFMPGIGGKGLERETRCRAADAGTLLAGLELARGGALTLAQDVAVAPIRVLPGETDRAAPCAEFHSVGKAASTHASVVSSQRPNRWSNRFSQLGDDPFAWTPEFGELPRGVFTRGLTKDLRAGGCMSKLDQDEQQAVRELAYFLWEKEGRRACARSLGTRAVHALRPGA